MNAFLRKSLFLLIAVLCTSFINAQYRYIDATFDADIPAEWTQETTAQSNSWVAIDSVAIFSGAAIDATSALITAPVDIAEVVVPIFNFSYRNEQFDGKLNDFAVYARVRPDTAWVVLFETSARMKNLSKQEIIIPDSLKSATFQLKFEVKNNGGDITAIDDVVLANSKSCVNAPTNLTIADLSQSSARITWMTDSFAVNTRISLYKIVQKEDKKNNKKEITEFVIEETLAANRMVNVFDAKNLNPGSDYRAYILADCQYGDISAYATIDFTTICDIWSTPYFDNFENYTLSDLDCWRISGKSASYTPMIDTTIAAQSGRKSLKFYTYIDYYAYAYTPQFDVEDISTMAVSFYIYSDKMTSSTYSSELVVGVLTNPADPSTFTPLHTVSPSQNATWQHVSVSLKDYVGDAYGDYGKYIAFRSGNADKTNYIWIDDVTLDKIGCFAPQLIVIEKLTGRELELSWTEMGLSKTYNVKVSKTELDSVGLTKPALIDMTVDTTFVSINTLEPNSKYYVYLQSECGSWIPDPLVVETEKVWAIGYSDNMTSYKTTVPAEWTTKDISMVTTASYNNKLDPIVSSTSGGAIKFMHSSSYVPYIVFPQLDVERIQDVQFSFWLYQYTKTAKGCGIVVAVCETSDTTNATPIDTIFPSDYTLGVYEKHIVTFENYTGNGKYVALYAPGGKASTSITNYIDDIQIDSLNNCNTPEGPECVKVTQTTADFRWASTGAKKWQIAIYSNKEMTGDAVQSLEVNNPYCTISGLEKATTYYAFVRSVSGENTSAWTAAVRFLTQDIITIPYSNDFTSETTGSGKEAPKGWFLYNTKETATATYIPYVATTAWSAATGSTIPTEVVKNSLYFNTTSANRDAYAVMPMLVDSVDIHTLLMSFYAHTNATTTSYGKGIEVGVMTDPNDPETFVKVSDIELHAFKVTEKFFVAFGGYQGTGRYIAFRSNLASTVQVMVDNIEIGFVSECSEVTNLKTDVLTNKDAVISWVKGNKETKWNLKVYDKQIEKDGIDTTTATIFDGEVTTNPYTLTGLKPLTTYYVYIQAKTDNCVGNWSQSLEFRTPCPDAFAVPYEMGFDEYANGNYPDCWILKGASSSGTVPQVYNGSNCYDYNTGTKEGNVFNMTSYYTGYSYAILPEIAEPISNLQLSFYAYSHKTSDVAYMEIGVMEDIDSTFLNPTIYWTGVPTNDKLFTLVERVEISEMKQWESFLISFDKYTGKGKRIAFRQGRHTTSSNGYFYLDNLKVDKMPDCRKIGSLEVKDITHQSAILHWSTNNETSWNIKVATKKINPNIEDTENVVIIEKAVTTMPCTLEGLDANTDYYVYVQGLSSTLNCVGEWSEPLQFITNCAPMALGYTDNFEQYRGKVGEGATLRCWIKSGSDQWIAYPFQYNTSNTGRGVEKNDSVCLYMQNNSAYNSTLESNTIVTSYLSTQALDVDSIEQVQISFRAFASSSTYTLGQFEVGVMTDPYDPTTYRAVFADTIPYNSATKEWTYYTVNFLNYTSDDYGDKGKHIVFRCMPGQNKTYPERVAKNQIYFDDIVIEPYSPCSTPRRVELIEATESGATFKWQSPEAESYRVLAMQREGANPAIAELDTIVKSNPATITGLKANTNYYVYVQTLCDDNAGQWSDPMQVRSLGCSDALPYYEGFEGHNVYVSSSVYTLPFCWQGYSQGVLADGGINENTSPAASSFLYITTGYSTNPTHTGSYHMLSANGALSILPDFRVDDVHKLSMSLYYSLGSTLYSLEVGVLEDINNPSSFVTLDVFTCDKANTYQELVIDFSKYDVVFDNKSRIALKAVSSGAYIDDVYVNYTDGLWKPANLEFVSATHNSVSFKWNQIGTPDSYDVILVNKNDTIRKSFTTNEVTVTDLTPNTEYDVFVYAVKDGVRSDVSNAFSAFTYQEPAQLPYATDFNNAEENAKWNFYTNGTSTNSWIFGTDATVKDTALYISSDGELNVYQVGVTSQSWAYRTIEVKEAGVYDVAFRTRFNATTANSAHKYKVMFMPANYIPSSSNLVSPYGGTSATAVINKKSNPLVVLEESFTSEGEWVDYVGKVIVEKPGYYNFSACFVTTTQKVTPTYAPAIDSLRIAAATCYTPYNVEIAEVLDTTVTLTWDDAKITSWDLIVATDSPIDPSTLTEDQIVVNTVLTTTEYVVKTQPAMNYYAYLKASCDTEWTILEIKTPCQQVILPYVNDFSSYVISSTLNHIDGTCWNTSNSKLTLNTTYHSPEVSNDTTMDIKTTDVYVMPLMPEEIKYLEIEFEMAHAAGTTAATRFELGVVTDPFNPKETFEALESFNCPGVFSYSNQMEFGKYYYNFANYDGAGRYIAFRSPNGGFYLDDIVVSKLPSCPRPYNLKATGITSNSANISWLAMANQNSWVVTVSDKELSASALDSLARNNGFIFMDTVTTNSAKVTGIPHTSVLYAYVKSNCDNEGAWSKPLEFNSGFEVSKLPYFEDFQTIAEDQLPLAWSRYDISYDEVKDGDALKPATPTSYSSFAVNIVNQKPDTLHSLYTTLYKSSTSANLYLWVVGPEVNISEKAMLSFDLKFAGSAYMKSLSNFKVLVSEDNGITWTALATFANRLNAEYHFADYFNAYKRVFIELDEYVGKVIRFAFYTEGLDANTVQVNIDNVAIKPASIYDYTDTGFEKRDYEGYGFAFEYLDMTPGLKEATRYAAGADLTTNDSIINLNIQVLPTLRNNIVDMMCPGDEIYEENGFLLSEPGVYQQRHVVASGADSIVTLTLGVFEGETEFALAKTIKKGESFIFGGKTLTESGVYIDSLVNQYGCDSIVVLTLSIEDSPIVGFESTELLELVLTPNPVQIGEELLINATFSAEELEGMIVEVFNAVGQCVYTSQPVVTPIAITGLPQAGVYMVNITTTSGNRYQGKVIVK